MSNEIKYPTERTYWVARSDDAEILHTGYTDPDQVTTTGQSVLVDGNRAVQTEEIAKHRGNPAAYNYEWDGQSWVFRGEDVIYIPARKAIAEPLSHALFTLIYGEKPGLYAAVHDHPSSENYSLLECTTHDEIPVAIAADHQPLVDVLQIAVDDGALTQAELDGIVDAVQSMAGHVVSLVDFVPPSWKPFVMTREQAEAAGYFEAAELL